MYLGILLVVGVVWSLEPAKALQCMDEDNTPVDWFVIYKLPKIADSTSVNVKRGSAYLYITSKTVNDSWTLSKKKIFDSNTAPAFTVAPYYKQNQSEVWAFYNDQPPGQRYSSWSGHTKGVVGADRNRGFWMVHSVPNYPPVDKYSYPGTGAKFGQNFICVSLSASQIDSLGENVLMYNQPNYYGVRISKELQTVYKNLAKATQGGRVRKAPWNRKSDLTSVANTHFQAFAKAKKFGRDLYEWVANDLTTNILTETWQNEPGKFTSECNRTYQVMNVESISIKNVNFSSSIDHSKWAIGTGKDKPWVCIGDINRAKPQTKRGGGTLCIRNNNLWTAYHNLTSAIEACPLHKSFLNFFKNDK